jgi:hypothetical protein
MYIIVDQLLFLQSQFTRTIATTVTLNVLLSLFLGLVKIGYYKII